MKSTAASALTPSSSRRSQPMRQARTNPVRRSTITTASKDTPRNGNIIAAAQQSFLNQKFYPALASFTDSIDALPAEVIRNFTLLREVDAKACHPEEQLRRYIAAAKVLPPPVDTNDLDPALDFLRRHEDLKRRREEALMNGENPPPETDVENSGETVEQFPETRRSRLQQVRMVLQDLLPMLDEKIHVIMGTVETLNKHNARVEQSYAYLQSEIPELYRVGDSEHWGYKPQPPRGSRAAAAERAASAQQAAAMAAAAAAAAEEARLETAASSRAELRREALARKQAAAAAAAGLEFDDAYPPAGSSTKRPHGNVRARKEVDSSAQRLVELQAASVGMGSPGSTIQQQKRRKPNSNAIGEKAGQDKQGNARATMSPRAGTPVGKRPSKATTANAGTSGSAARRRPNAASAAHSPNLASSPVQSAFSPSVSSKGNPSGAINGKEQSNSPFAGLSGSPWPSAAAVSKPVASSAGNRNSRDRADKQMKESGLSKEISEALPSSAGIKGRATDNIAEGMEDMQQPSVAGGRSGASGGSKSARKDVLPDASSASATTAKIEVDTVGDSENIPIMKTANALGIDVGIAPVAIGNPGDRRKVGTPASPTKRDVSKIRNVVPINDAMEGLEPTIPFTSVAQKGNNDLAEDMPRPTHHKRSSVSSTGATSTSKRKRGSIDQSQAAHQNEVYSAVSSSAADHHHKGGRSNTTGASSSSHSRAAASSTNTIQSNQYTKSSRDRDRDHSNTALSTRPSASSYHTSITGTQPRHMKIEKLDEDEIEDEPEVEEEAAAEEEDEEMDEPDPDEPRYCICNQVSYGEMVGCDGEGCRREWFHLSCVGLTHPPKGKAKWYCDECKSRTRRGGHHGRG